MFYYNFKHYVFCFQGTSVQPMGYLYPSKGIASFRETRIPYVGVTHGTERVAFFLFFW